MLRGRGVCQRLFLSMRGGRDGKELEISYVPQGIAMVSMRWCLFRGSRGRVVGGLRHQGSRVSSLPLFSHDGEAASQTWRQDGEESCRVLIGRQPGCAGSGAGPHMSASCCSCAYKFIFRLRFLPAIFSPP